MTAELAGRHDDPLASEGAWIGTWVRVRSGPTLRGSVVDVARWHRVARIHPESHLLVPVCRPRSAIMWPSGGGRLEVARPFTYRVPDLPGDVCPRCATLPATAPGEPELATRDELDDADLDYLIDRILDRMRVRAEAKL